MTEQPTAGATLDGEHDHYWDLRPIVNDDLAAFVRDEDRHRSMTVVREPGDPRHRRGDPPVDGPAPRRHRR